MTQNSIQKLRNLLGLSENQVAYHTGTPIEEIQQIEKNPDSISFQTERVKDYLEKEKKKYDDFLATRKAFTKHFEVGKKYYIMGNENNKFEVDVSEYLFEFVKDEGIHHCFKSVQGGWTRTYTDAQLVGKQIKEESE